MGWYYRKTSKLGPLRLTASKSGLSVSSGSKHYRQSVSTAGRRTSTWRLFGWFRRKSRG